MRLVTYLAGDYPGGKPETQADFGRRAGIGQATVSRVLTGSGCNAATARAIVYATGGLVTLDDLAPADSEAAAPSGETLAAG